MTSVGSSWICMPAARQLQHSPRVHLARAHSSNLSPPHFWGFDVKKKKDKTNNKTKLNKEITCKLYDVGGVLSSVSKIKKTEFLPAFRNAHQCLKWNWVTVPLAQLHEQNSHPHFSRGGRMIVSVRGGKRDTGTSLPAGSRLFSMKFIAMKTKTRAWKCNVYTILYSWSWLNTACENGSCSYRSEQSRITALLVVKTEYKGKTWAT